MSSFNQRLNDSRQFIIAIKIIKSSQPEEYQPSMVQQRFTEATPKRALIDTGASGTCIAQECADALGFAPIGKTTIVTANGSCDVNQYNIDLAIPVGTTMAQPIEKEDGEQRVEQMVIDETHWAHTQLTINSIPAIGKDRGFDAILGMDILSQMHITMFGGNIVMSF